jgi:hypothetical protein
MAGIFCGVLKVIAAAAVVSGLRSFAGGVQRPQWTCGGFCELVVAAVLGQLYLP